MLSNDLPLVMLSNEVYLPRVMLSNEVYLPRVMLSNEVFRNDPKFSDRQDMANSADPDQTAPRGAV